MTDQQKVARMDKIQVQIQHMTTLLEDVLTLGRLEAGAVEFKPELLDLDGLFREVVEEFRQVWSKRLLIYTGSDEVGQVTADRKLIRQIVTNLLTNAGKYSPEESPVSLSLTRENEALVFRVKDEGVGIPENDRKHLFEAFHRAANVGTVAGTGLGLSIVKHAVDLHGGTITFESTVGAGTEFIVTIPVRQNEEQAG
jgi:signal transduction histidine kinase